MANYEATKQEILALVSNTYQDFEKKHALSVNRWLEKLAPDADDAMRIAAIAHDVERALNSTTAKELSDNPKLNLLKWKNAGDSAHLVGEIMQKNGYDKITVEKTRKLIKRSGTGGDECSDLVMSADNMAYFEDGMVFFFHKHGRDKTKEDLKRRYKDLVPEAQALIDELEIKDPEIEAIFKEAIAEEVEEQLD